MLYLIITLLLQIVPGMWLGRQINCNIGIAKGFHSYLHVYVLSQLAGKKKPLRNVKVREAATRSPARDSKLRSRSPSFSSSARVKCIHQIQSPAHPPSLHPHMSVEIYRQQKNLQVMSKSWIINSKTWWWDHNYCFPS